MTRKLPPPGQKSVIEIDFGGDNYFLHHHEIINDFMILFVYRYTQNLDDDYELTEDIPVLVNFKEMTYTIVRISNNAS